MDILYVVWTLLVVLSLIFASFSFMLTFRIIIPLYFLSRMGELNGIDEDIDFQTAYVADIAKESNYPYIIDSSKLLHAWFQYKMDDITTYRSRSYTSMFTGTKSPVFPIPFMQEFDDSMEHFINTEQ